MRSARARWKSALLLVVGGTFAGLFLVELAVRVASGSLFTWGGPDAERHGITDPLLGRVPRPGTSMHHPKGFTINIGEHSIRSNGDTPPRAARPLMLAVGDSFAFGDEVDDEDSWPAVLERLTGARVLNGAVPGFGLDQAVLRAEQLAELYGPDIIIVGFIPHDVLRCEMSYWQGLSKPYFTLDGSGLRLHPLVLAAPSSRGLLKRVLSFSATLDLLYPFYLHGEGPALEVVHHDGPEVACRLMPRLAALGRARRARIVVLAQPQAPDSSVEYVQLKDRVLACARASHLLTLDVFPPIEARPPAERARLFHGHMTAEGNRLIANELARFLAAIDSAP